MTATALAALTACATTAAPAPADVQADAVADVAMAESMQDGPTLTAGLDGQFTGPACFVATDCPPTTATCALQVCANGHCALGAMPDGTACVPGSFPPGCGRPAVCAAATCVETSPYAAKNWPAATGATVYAACGEYAMVAVGTKTNATWPGTAGWLATTSPSTESKPITWSAGYAVSFEHCGGGYSGNWALGWQQNGDLSERDGIAMKLDFAGKPEAVYQAGVAGDDQVTAVAAFGWAGSVLIGEHTTADTGIDARWIRLQDGKTVANASLPLAGDQYVRDALDVLDNKFVLCGYQSVGGAKADGWLAAVSTQGQLQWQSALGDGQVQRLYACVRDGDNVFAVGTSVRLADSEERPQAWAVKVNHLTGAVMWQRTLRHSGNAEELRGLAHDAGGLLATGFARGAAKEHLLTARFDFDGWPLAMHAWPQIPGRGIAVTAGDQPTIIAAAAPPATGAWVVHTDWLGAMGCHDKIGKCESKTCKTVAPTAKECTWVNQAAIACGLSNGQAGFCTVSGDCAAAD